MNKNIENLLAKKNADRYISRSDVKNCLVQRFFEDQAKLPASVRANGAYISCPCKRCNPYTL